MWRFIIDVSAGINTGRVEKKVNTVPHGAKSISIIDMIETRTISEQLSKTLEQLASAKIYWFLLKKARIWSVLGVISYCCCSYEYF